MNWTASHWLDILRLGGTALHGKPRSASHRLRMRVLITVPCLTATDFNGHSVDDALQVWPVMTALVLCDAFSIARLVGICPTRRVAVLEDSPTDQYLRHMLRVHGADIAMFNPSSACQSGTDGALLLPSEQGFPGRPHSPGM